MKALKFISITFTAVSAFLICFMPWLSSKMQSFYKSQLPASTEVTKELLEKKQFWVSIGESNVFGVAFIVCLCLLLTVFLIDFIIKKKNK